MTALLASFALVSVQENQKIAKLTDMMYRHPFAVSNSVQEINTNITAMHRSMKDVALAESSEQLERAIKRVNLREQNVLRSFELVKKQFLGDKKTVNNAFSAFINWKAIRSEVIELRRAGKHREAAGITRGKGDKHVQLLARQMGSLIDFAHNKAEEFLNESHRISDASRALLFEILGLIVAASLLTAGFVVMRVRRVEQANLNSERRIRAIVENAADGIIVFSERGVVQSFSPAAESIFGFLAAEMLGNNINTLLPGLIPRENNNRLLQGSDLGQPLSTGQNQEFIGLHKNGRDFPLELTVGEFKIAGERMFTGILRNITERKHAVEKLQLAANVFTHAREGIFISDAAGTIIETNETFSQITGYSRQEAIGQNPRLFKSGRQTPEYYTAMWQALLENGYWSGEIWNQRKNGEIFAEMLTISAVRHANGDIQNYVALFSDITLQKTHEQQLEHIAHYDVLTSLPNRVLLADRLQQAMAQTQRRGQVLALAYLDLDGFKEINDTHGHNVGDELLITIAERMVLVLREGDTLARIGGDEFVVVLVDLETQQEIEPILERLLRVTADPVNKNDSLLCVSASIGVTLYPQDGLDADLLLRHADQAMYSAKQAGKNRYHLFDVNYDAELKTRHENQGDIRRALGQGEFVLYYQPKVNMKTGVVVGSEALIRWQHPERGLLPPAAFLPIIEDHSISVELGEWVIDSALSQASKWQAMGLNTPVSVNIGARQFKQKDFVARLSMLLAAYPDFKPGLLELEILETSALEDVERVSELMHACRALGVTFSLDDFGTGYSSLTYLKRLPAHQLKIDQTFVRDMLKDPHDLAIVEGVIGLATAFHLEVIAEGVETATHGLQLMELGCLLAQGYYIARPMPADEFPLWVSNWQLDATWGGAKRPK